MRVAIIGCGKQGARHAAAFAGCAAVTGLVVTDQDEARGAALASRHGALCYPSADAIFADPAIAAIVIATPTPSHHALARRAIAAGKHVMCEKPFGSGAAAALDLAQAATAAGRVAEAGYLYRFAPAIAAARCNVEALGRIETARFAIAAPGGEAAWKHRRAAAGGVTNELLSHMLDLAGWFFGPTAGCEVLEKHLVRPRRTIAGATIEADAADVVVARLAMQSGLSVTVQGDFAAPRFAQSLEIIGENGVVRASIAPQFASFCELHRPAAGFPAGRHALPASIPGALYRDQAHFFLAATLTGVRGPASDLGAAAATLRLIDAIDAAPMTGAGPTVV
ncbi:MAG: Gfo/Idh/MocA family protein [Stellaceae bacterium]